MKFKMNDHTWEIVEVGNDEIFDEYNKDADTSDIARLYAFVRYSDHKLFLNVNNCYYSQNRALLHELMHIYIYEYCSWEMNFNEEIVCDLMSNSHDLIHKIADKYWNGKIE